MSRLRLTHWSVTVDLVFPRKESSQVFFRPLRARSVPLSHLHNCPISDALSEIPDLIANHDISLSSVRRSRRWGPERDRCFTHGIRLKERDGLAIKQPFHYFFLRNLKIKESITSSLQTGEFGKGRFSLRFKRLFPACSRHLCMKLLRCYWPVPFQSMITITKYWILILI